MPFPCPGHGPLDAVVLFSSIQTTTKFGLTAVSKVSRLLVCPSHPTDDYQLGFRTSYRPPVSHFSCHSIQENSPAWYRPICMLSVLVELNWPRTIKREGSVYRSTEMYLLKRARRTDGAIMGDAVPLAHLRTLVDLVPRSGKAANRQLAKETVWSAAQNSGLISILRKNSFMPQKNASRFPTCTKSKSFNPLFCVGHYCADAPLAVPRMNWAFSWSRRMSTRLV
jgi:hypothetical protein